jgi:hypothetical protein
LEIHPVLFSKTDSDGVFQTSFITLKDAINF